MVRFVLSGLLASIAVATALTSVARSDTPRPYPTVLVSLPPLVPLPSPKATLREIGRVRVLACMNERTMANNALNETAHADGVVVGVLKRLGETRFSLDYMSGEGAPPSFGPAKPPAPGALAGPTPLPGTTDLPVIVIAKDASKPYWQGTRKLLDASGDLEQSIRAAAEAIDKLQKVVNTDPNPERRKQVQETILALTDAVVRQAPLVKKLNEFAIRADTVLSLQEMRSTAQQTSQNLPNSVFAFGDPESDAYKLSAETKIAHEATAKAVRTAVDMNDSAFKECPPAPHPQATARP